MIGLNWEYNGVIAFDSIDNNHKNVQDILRYL